jgi:hypothetical protein
MGLDMMLIHDGDEITSWRKANAIHKWFVDNVQNGVDDCGYYKVTKEHLIQLHNACNDILNDNNLAEHLLPTQGGFFFGMTEYNDWYYNDLKETKSEINYILEFKSYVFEGDGLYYYSSW